MATDHTSDQVTLAAGAIPNRLSLVTLGVADVMASRAFYERLGFKASGFESDEVCFFEMNGSILGLFGRSALAEDAGVADHAPDVAPDGGRDDVARADRAFRAVACAINLDSTKAVDEALKLAESAGAVIVKPAVEVFWGGYSGYFADPDGHLWEIAYNPVFPLGGDGRLRLPAPLANAETNS